MPEEQIETTIKIVRSGLQKEVQSYLTDILENRMDEFPRYTRSVAYHEAMESTNEKIAKELWLVYRQFTDTVEAEFPEVLNPNYVFEEQGEEVNAKSYLKKLFGDRFSVEKTTAYITTRTYADKTEYTAPSAESSQKKIFEAFSQARNKLKTGEPVALAFPVVALKPTWKSKIMDVFKKIVKQINYELDTDFLNEPNLEGTAIKRSKRAVYDSSQYKDEVVDGYQAVLIVDAVGKGSKPGKAISEAVDTIEDSYFIVKNSYGTVNSFHSLLKGKPSGYYVITASYLYDRLLEGEVFELMQTRN